MSLSLLGIGMPGLPEMLVILFVVLLLFGGAKLPSLMRNMGRSANEFKRGMKDADDEGDEGDAAPHEKHEKHEV
jgi:sec-independent protein translocase protein TatA